MSEGIDLNGRAGLRSGRACREGDDGAINGSWTTHIMWVPKKSANSHYLLPYIVMDMPVRVLGSVRVDTGILLDL
jgi:hypothetical protein